MRLDDRFDDLIGSLGGFHRTWLVYLGIELGLFAALRSAGSAGLTIEALAARPDATSGGRLAGPSVPTRRSSRRSRAIVSWRPGRRDGAHRRRPGGIPGRPVRPRRGGLADWGGMVDFFGPPTDPERPDAHRVAIERLTAQDIAVFFQEALAAYSSSPTCHAAAAWSTSTAAAAAG
jgi:hypothetical protein